MTIMAMAFNWLLDKCQKQDLHQSDHILLIENCLLTTVLKQHTNPVSNDKINFEYLPAVLHKIQLATNLKHVIGG